jgi:hypothetical protein
MTGAIGGARVFVGVGSRVYGGHVVLPSRRFNSALLAARSSRRAGVGLADWRVDEAGAGALAARRSPASINVARSAGETYQTPPTRHDGRTRPLTPFRIQRWIVSTVGVTPVWFLIQRTASRTVSASSQEANIDIIGLLKAGKHLSTSFNVDSDRRPEKHLFCVPDQTLWV